MNRELNEGCVPAPGMCTPYMPEGVKHFMDNASQALVQLEEERARKAAQYADVVGRRFRPTFKSDIGYFEIRGYDKKRDMVLTTAYPNEGSPFDDEIEEPYLMGGFANGDYKPVNDNPWPDYERELTIMMRPYFDMAVPASPRRQKFIGPCCSRCLHRFGTTSNSEWCMTHWQSDNCYRFKLKD